MTGDRAAPTKRPGSAPTAKDDRPECNGDDALPTGERAELHRQGAKAAARGESVARNPLHQPENSPEATGESAQTWWQRIKAWQRGHEAQSRAARSSAADHAGEPDHDRD